MFRKKEIACPAGEWTTIIQSSFAQMPATWDVHLRSESAKIAGEFEEKKSAWVFPGQPVGGQLREQLTFKRGYWNTFYLVRIRPKIPIVVEMR